METIADLTEWGKAFLRHNSFSRKTFDWLALGVAQLVKKTNQAGGGEQPRQGQVRFQSCKKKKKKKEENVPEFKSTRSDPALSLNPFRREGEHIILD